MAAIVLHTMGVTSEVLLPLRNTRGLRCFTFSLDLSSMTGIKAGNSSVKLYA
jgi:hypothetical protein